VHKAGIAVVERDMCLLHWQVMVLCLEGRLAQITQNGKALLGYFFG
jgi:hypothetical protein